MGKKEDASKAAAEKADKSTREADRDAAVAEAAARLRAEQNRRPNKWERKG